MSEDKPTEQILRLLLDESGTEVFRQIDELDEFLKSVKPIPVWQELLKPPSSNCPKIPDLVGLIAQEEERKEERLAEKIARAQANQAIPSQPDISRAKGGRPRKYDWYLVVQLAVEQVKDIYYQDGELPTAEKLAEDVADRYNQDGRRAELDTYGSDLKKYCSAVLKGFKA